MLNAETIRLATAAVRAHGRPEVMGRVHRVTGLMMEAHLPGARIGETIEVEQGGGRIPGEVVGFRENLALIIPIGEVRGIAPGARVHITGGRADMPVSEKLLGRVIDPFGLPLDGGPPILTTIGVPIDMPAPGPEARAPINERFDTSVRVIDGLLTCGRGQRVGIFAGAGVGKTLLMRQIASQSRADVTVVGLIGERGVEVHDFLTSPNRERTVIVAATSDRSPMERARGARSATAVAEFFRDRGANVLLIIDSLTRYAMALREIGLSAGEPPATKGYPPSVFATMPRLLERACPMAHGGSITGVYTVLVEGDDLADPVADAARSLLDGHIVLSRDLAARGHFPAVDVLPSASRVALKVTGPREQGLMERARTVLATRREVEELRSLGAYVPGTHPPYDEALLLGAKLDGWMRQSTSVSTAYEDSMTVLASILETGGSA